MSISTSTQVDLESVSFHIHTTTTIYNNNLNIYVQMLDIHIPVTMNRYIHVVHATNVTKPHKQINEY
jgi:hypothetical protein